MDITKSQKKMITKEHVKKDLERKMWTAGFRFS